MIKTLSIILGLSFSLCSCDASSKSGGDVDPYKIDKASFLYECNRDTVVFKSNYHVDLIMNDNPYRAVDFDYGKVISNGDYYHLVDKGEYVEYTYYRNDGDPNSNVVSKEHLYDFWFGMGDYFFDMKYEDYTYNKTKKQYECNNVQLGDLVIETGVFVSYKKKPIHIEFIIKDQGVFKAEFSKHGEVKVTLPTAPTYYSSVTLDYELETGTSLEAALASRLGGLDIDYTLDDIGNNKCRIVFSYQNYREVSLIESILTSRGDARISNAHDRFSKLDKNVSITDDDTLLIPFDLTKSENYTLLQETFDDVENGRTEYAERVTIEGENEEEILTYYYYYLYIWYDYDESNCFSEVSNGVYTNLFTKIPITSTSMNNYSNGIKVGFIMDLNHDGEISTYEEEYASRYTLFVQKLLNMEPDGCTFDYAS